MAVATHTPATIGEVIADLENLIVRLKELQAGMLDGSIEEMGIDYDRMQISGRLWLHRFAGDGQERLRAVKAGVVLGKKPTDASRKKREKQR